MLRNARMSILKIRSASTAWPLVPPRIGCPSQFYVSLPVPGFRWPVGVPVWPPIPKFRPDMRRPEFLLCACARAGLRNAQKPHATEHSFPWGSKVYNYRDWPRRGDPWGPLITRRMVQNVKMAWASYAPRGPKSTRFQSKRNKPCIRAQGPALIHPGMADSLK